jgi:hypothetical protein
MIIPFSKPPTPTSIACSHAGVWAQFQPQQWEPSKGSSVEAVCASRPSLHGLWCAEFTPEEKDRFPVRSAATPVIARDACVGPSLSLIKSNGAPPARPFSQPANLPGSVERGASGFS